MDALLSPRTLDAGAHSCLMPGEPGRRCPRPPAASLGQSGRPGFRMQARGDRFATLGTVPYLSCRGRPKSVVRSVLSADFGGGSRRSGTRMQKAEAKRGGEPAEEGDARAPDPKPRKGLRPRSPKMRPRREASVSSGGGDRSEEENPRESPARRSLEAVSANPRDARLSRPSSGLGAAATMGRHGRERASLVRGGKDPDLVRVRFSIQFHVEYGQRMKVVGSHKALGAWSIDNAPEMAWSKGDVWHVSVQLPMGNVYEYKYAVMAADGQVASSWQRGNNCVLAVGMDSEDIDVFDNWEGLPGASVISGGNVSTREKCLLSWATEIERYLGESASSLKKLTLQLQEAREAAQLARQESARLRAELRVESVARRAAEEQVRELELINRQLKAQLQEQHFLSRKVMKEALKLLTDAIEERDDAAQDGGLTRGTVLSDDSPPGKTPESSSFGIPATSTSVPSMESEPETEKVIKNSAPGKGSSSLGSNKPARKSESADFASNNVVEKETTCGGPTKNVEKPDLLARN